MKNYRSNCTASSQWRGQRRSWHHRYSHYSSDTKEMNREQKFSCCHEDTYMSMSRRRHRFNSIACRENFPFASRNRQG